MTPQVHLARGIVASKHLQADLVTLLSMLDAAKEIRDEHRGTPDWLRAVEGAREHVRTALQLVSRNAVL